MAEADRVRWDERYRERSELGPVGAARWLVENLPTTGVAGTALDLAAGDGCNSIYLARQGWRVTAVDISAVGLEIGRRVGDELPIEWIAADLDEYLPPLGAFDLVVCFRFLDRVRLPALVARGLRPGGYLLAETFNDCNGAPAHVQNPDHLLHADEWLSLFPDYEIIAHDQTGPTSKLFARRPQ